MICLYSRTNTNYNTNGDAVLNPISAQLQLTLNGVWVLTLSHPYDQEEKWKLLEEGATIQAPITCIRELSTTLQRFKIYQRQKNMHDVSVIAFPEGMEATFDTPVDNLVITNKTAAQTIDLLQPFCNNKYTLYTNLTTNGSTSWANTNIFSAIAGSSENTFLKTWGGELIFDNKTFKILSRVGDTTAANHKITYGHNLSAIDYDKDDSGVTTRIYPISQDGIRLNGNGYIDSPNHFSDYPVAHCRHMTAPYYLVDTNPGNNTATAAATQQATAAIATQAETLGRSSYATAIGGGFQPEYIKQQRDAIIAAVKAQALSGVVNASMYAAFEKAIESGLSFLASVQQPAWGWMGSEEQGWKYGDANGYATNQYIRISRKWSYFGSDGNWQEPRDDSEEWDWYQGSSGTGKKYGNFKKYYAHNEFIYITEDNQMKEYWFNEQGWYESDESGDSDWDWHGSGTSEDPWWFGEEGASAGDTRKYAHDCWLFINGTLYFFDSYGYYDGSTKFEYYQWEWVQDDERWWFGNAIDKTYAATYLTNQWAKINGDWYYFDANGYAEQTNASIARVVAVFTNGMTGLTSTITTNKSTLYTLLYNQLSDWALKQYTQGIDLPVITITVNMVDLSKTQDYQGFADLETVKLGDSVAVTDAEHGISTTNRVVGLTYDLINDYNAEVIIGSATASVASMISGAAGQAVAGGFDSSAIETQLNTQATAIAQLRQNKQDQLTAGNLINLSGSTISADIEANPGAAGTTDLQKIRLGNTIFNLPSGGGGQGLQYWTETSEKISRNIEETVPQGDFICDNIYYRSYGLDITTQNGGSVRVYKSLEEAPAICAIMHIQGTGTEVWNYGIVISPNLNTAKLTNGQGAQSREILGRTFYVNTSAYFQPGIITDDDNLPDIGFFESFSDGVNYLISNAGISITAYKETGIGVGDKVIWGGIKEHSTDTPPFYVTDNGMVYGKKHISKGTHEGLSADAHVYNTGFWNNFVGGLANGFEYRKINNEYALMGWFGAALNKAICLVSSESANAVKWQFRSRGSSDAWQDMSAYSTYSDKMWTTSFVYNNTTWYMSVIGVLNGSSTGGTVEGLDFIDQSIIYGTEASAIDLSKHFIDVTHAKELMDVFSEVGTESYCFRYGGATKNFVAIDIEGNAVFKEITTDAGTLTDQMEAKQDNLIAGANIQIGADGKTISATNTTYEDFTGSTHGLVPPVESQSGKVLSDSGAWVDSGVYVEANPSETASATLNKVTIGNTVYSVPSGGGGGGGSFVGLTKSQYDALPTADKEDTSKLYFVQEGGGLPIIEDLIQTASDWNSYREGSMTVNWVNDTIVFDWLGGSSIGCNIVKIVPIPASATKIKFKITTGNSYSNTIDRFRVFIGVRTTYQTGVILPYYSINDWLVKSDYYTRNSVWESELDLSGVTVDTYLYITAHGWDATVDYLKLETPSAAKVTRHIYWNDAKWAQWKTNEITYGTTAPTEAGTDGDLFILLDNNNNKIGEYLFITNAWVQIE